MGAQRLHPRLRRPAAARRPDGRHPRPAAHVHRRSHAVHAWAASSPASRRTSGCCSPDGRSRAWAARSPRRPRCRSSPPSSRRARSAPARSPCTPRCPAPAPRSGLLLGGILTNYLSWRWVLFVNVPIGLVLIAGAFLYLHQSERLRGRFDVIGALAVGRRHGRDGLRLHPRRAQRLGQHRDLRRVRRRGRPARGFVFFEAKVVAEPMMPMRIFENRNRSGAYLVMFVVGAAMFGMFYFITFFIQGVREYSAAAHRLRVPARGVHDRHRLAGRRPSCCPVGPKPLLITGTMPAHDRAAVVLAGDADSRYSARCCPACSCWPSRWDACSSRSRSTAVSKVANTDAGLASALLNVGQQVGGALGLSVMTTVFGTPARNYASDHIGSLIKSLAPSVGRPAAGRRDRRRS